MLTFGADGLSRHPDHIAIGFASAECFRRADDVSALFMLGEKEISSWYANLIGGLMTLVASHATNDYLYGALMGLSIVVMLLIPVFRQHLPRKYSG